MWSSVLEWKVRCKLRANKRRLYGVSRARFACTVAWTSNSIDREGVEAFDVSSWCGFGNAGSGAASSVRDTVKTIKTQESLGVHKILVHKIWFTPPPPGKVLKMRKNCCHAPHSPTTQNYIPCSNHDHQTSWLNTPALAQCKERADMESPKQIIAVGLVQKEKSAINLSNFGKICQI